MVPMISVLRTDNKLSSVPTTPLPGPPNHSTVPKGDSRPVRGPIRFEYIRPAMGQSLQVGPVRPYHKEASEMGTNTRAIPGEDKLYPVWGPLGIHPPVSLLVRFVRFLPSASITWRSLMSLLGSEDRMSFTQPIDIAMAVIPVKSNRTDSSEPC